MFGRNKNEPQKLQVALGDLEDQKQNLKTYLEAHLKIEVAEAKNNLAVESDKTNLSDLHHAVKKFIYHRDLNTTHFTTLETNLVRINRFKDRQKKEKSKKEQPTQSITQSWGL